MFQGRSIPHMLVGIAVAAPAICGLIVVPGSKADPQPHSTVGVGPETVAGELIVRFRPEAGATGRERARDRGHVTLERRLLDRDMQLLHVQPGRSVGESLDALSHDPAVGLALPNVVAHVATVPNDPLFGSLWGLQNTGQTVNGVTGLAGSDMDAPLAWNQTTGSSSVVVAVIDTGVDSRVPDLAPNTWHNPGESGSGKESNGLDDDHNGFVDDAGGWDFVDNDNAPDDSHPVVFPRGIAYHGTHVAGTIAAAGNDGRGTTGVAWRSKIMPVRVCGALGFCELDAILDGIAYAHAMGADVANMSIGGAADTTIRDAYTQAFQAAAGTLYVTAAGNDRDNVDLPFAGGYAPCGATATNVVCVAASDSSDRLASFSNFGTTSVDLSAPGVNILSTAPSRSLAFKEDFESAQNPPVGPKWSAGGSPSTWTRTTEQGGSGGHTLTDSPGGNYPDNAHNYARMTEPIELGNRKSCELNVRYSLPFDDGGDRFSLETSFNGKDWIDYEINQWQHDDLTPDTSFHVKQLLLSNDSKLWLGFRLDSDDTATGDGIHVDDIQVTCRDDENGGATFAYYDGTSMATPHVTGAAALVKALDPAADPAVIRHALIAGAEPRPGLTGKVATNGRVNANGALNATKSSAAVSAKVLRFDDRTPRANRLTISKSGSATVLDDPGNPIAIGSGCSYLSSTDLTRVKCTGATSVSANGGDGDDTIDIQAPLPATLNGGNGADRLLAGPSGSQLNGGPGGDVLVDGTGRDRFSGGPDSDLVDFSRRSEAVVALLSGGPFGAGDNDQQDTIEGVIGGSGVNILIGDNQPNVLIGGGKGDLIDGQGGSDWLLGLSGPDTITSRDPVPGAYVFWSDLVDCGPDRDSVKPNHSLYADVINNCEAEL